MPREKKSKRGAHLAAMTHVTQQRRSTTRAVATRTDHTLRAFRGTVGNSIGDTWAQRGECSLPDTVTTATTSGYVCSEDEEEASSHGPAHTSERTSNAVDSAAPVSPLSLITLDCPGNHGLHAFALTAHKDGTLAWERHCDICALAPQRSLHPPPLPRARSCNSPLAPCPRLEHTARDAKI